MSEPLALSLYRAASKALSPAVPFALSRRVRNNKEDPKRLNERVAQNLGPRGSQPLVWLHGASVGETLVLARIVNALAIARPDARCIVTSQTLASSDMLSRRLPAGMARQQMAPVDTPEIARRFLDHWRPDLGVFAEGEIWPNLLLEATARKIPLALVNARMTRHSLENWLRCRESARKLFGGFSFIGAADDLTALGLQQILDKDIKKPGNLKLDAPAPNVDRAELQRLSGLIGARPVWLAASTHPGDEALAIAAHAVLRTHFPDALLILAPRHSNRAEEVARLVPPSMPMARRSHSEPINAQTTVYLADTMGELGLWFSLASVCMMGGGFKSSIGGHNPIEPARLGVYVLSGPHVHNFKDAYDAIALHEAGAILADDNPRTLADAVQTELAGKRNRDDLAQSNTGWLPPPDAALGVTMEELLSLAALKSSPQNAAAKNAAS